MKRLTLLISLLLSFVPLLAPAQNNARMLSGVNYQAGTTYPFVALDATRITAFSSASPVTATLGSGMTFGFGKGSVFTVVNLGAGPVTVNCSGCTINGSSSLTPLLTSWAADIYGDGLNYVAFVSNPTGGGGGGGTLTGILTGSASGLQGGGSTGTLNLQLLQTCGAGQLLQWSGSLWNCSTYSSLTNGLQVASTSPPGLPAFTNFCPVGIAPASIFQRLDTTYASFQGVDETTTPGGLQAGTMTWCHRAYFNDTSVPIFMKNALVSIYHTWGNGNTTSTAADDRALAFRIETLGSISGAFSGSRIQGIYGEVGIKGAPTAFGSGPDQGQDGARIVVDDEHTSTLTTISRGVTGVYTQANAGAVYSGCQVCGQGLTGQVNLVSPANNAGVFFAGVAARMANGGASTNSNGVDFYAPYSESGNFLNQWGLWCSGSYRTSDWCLINDSAAPDFLGSGGLFTGGISSTGGPMPVSGSLTGAQSLSTTQLPAQTPTTVTNVGTPGGTTYTYEVCAKDGNGGGICGSTLSTTTGNATLNGSNFNAINLTGSPCNSSVSSYDVYRTVGGATQGKIGNFSVAGLLNRGAPTACIFNDQGAAGDGTTPPPGNTTGSMVANGYGSFGNGITYGNVVDVFSRGVGADGAAKIRSVIADNTLCPNAGSNIGCVLDLRNPLTPSDLLWKTNPMHGANKAINVLLGPHIYVACQPIVDGQTGYVWFGIDAPASNPGSSIIRAGTLAIENCPADFPGGASAIVMSYQHGPFPAGTYHALITQGGQTSTDSPTAQKGDTFGARMINIQLDSNGLADFTYFSPVVEERSILNNISFKNCGVAGTRPWACAFYDREFQSGPTGGGGSGPSHFGIQDVVGTMASSASDTSGVTVTTNIGYAVVQESNSTYVQFSGASGPYLASTAFALYGCTAAADPKNSFIPTAYSTTSAGVPNAPVLTNAGNCTTPPTSCALLSDSGLTFSPLNVCTLTTGATNVATISYTTAGGNYPTTQVPDGGMWLERATFTGIVSGPIKWADAIWVEGVYELGIYGPVHTENVAGDAVSYGHGSAPNAGGTIMGVSATSGTGNCVVHFGNGFLDNSYVALDTQREISTGNVICDDNVRSGSTYVLATGDAPANIHRRIPVYSGTSAYAKFLQLTSGVFAALPTCNATNEGLEASVTDDNTAIAFNATITGGGANHVHAYCDGTNWKMQ